MTTISAKTILRSRNAAAPEKVLSTLLLRYPRWIHAEQKTHRIISLGEDELFWEESTPDLMADKNLSRNAGSSRALPVSKLIQDVIDEPAIPLFWGANQPGMQARKELTGTALAVAQELWQEAMDNAIRLAQALAAQGAHKQIVNRILEPFSHITVLVSATEWDNFLELRDHEDAEPHIGLLAKEVRKCLDRKDDIQTLHPGEWHLPFTSGDGFEDGTEITTEAAIKLSVARCASTSYKTVDGFDMTLARATAIYDKLITSKPIHASPAEHVAMADGNMNNGTSGYSEPVWANPHQHGNFVGFRQHRHMLEH